MEFLGAGCFIIPLSALWIQTQEDDSDEDGSIFFDSTTP